MPKAKKPRKYSWGWVKKQAGRPEVAPWVVFLALLVFTLELELAFPFAVHLPWVVSTIGWLLLTISIFIIWAAQVFLTEADHDKAEDRLKTWGLYSYSRNPMYLGYIIFFIGLGLGAGAGWFILVGAWTGPVLTVVVIPDEEAALQRKFGKAYTRYKQKTRRWL